MDFVDTITVTPDLNGCIGNPEQYIITIGQPAVNLISFTSDTNGCVPLEIVFTNTTDTSLITSLEWDFGNGVTSSENVDSTIYDVSGDYDVSLTVTDTNGCVGTLYDTAYVTAFEKPVADFTFSPDEATLQDPTYDFTDESTLSVIDWSWNFNDLDSSDLQNTEYTFPLDDTGSYFIELMVVDTNDCRDTISKMVRVIGSSDAFVAVSYTHLTLPTSPKV